VLSEQILKVRHKSVINYLTLYESAAHHTWSEMASWISTIELRLLLVHPGWHKGNPDVSLDLVSFSTGAKGVECQAQDLWGYKCPITNPILQADHIFPRSLGGPRRGTNMMWLCSIHNGWKAADLLSFPWERGEPPWLEEQLQRVDQLLPIGAQWQRSG
jgi:hypothetical protein